MSTLNSAGFRSVGYEEVGCYADEDGERIMGDKFSSTSMTVEVGA